MSALDLFSGSSPVLSGSSSLGYSNQANPDASGASSDISGTITSGKISGNNSAGFTVPTIFYVGIVLFGAAALLKMWKK